MSKSSEIPQVKDPWYACLLTPSHFFSRLVFPQVKDWRKDNPSNVILNKEQILVIVRRLAKRIILDNQQGELNFVIVLDGADRFSKDLITEINKINKLKIKKHYIKLKSYSGARSVGRIKIIKAITSDISNKDLIIIEDIVDTGLTSSFLRKYLIKKKAKSVKLCSLLNKPSRRKVKVKIDYLGNTIPNLFVIGYGMDYNGKYRGLDSIKLLELGG
jgi:hypoxanthine phosphoribosyltransferase